MESIVAYPGLSPPNRTIFCLFTLVKEKLQHGGGFSPFNCGEDQTPVGVCRGALTKSLIDFDNYDGSTRIIQENNSSLSHNWCMAHSFICLDMLSSILPQ